MAALLIAGLYFPSNVRKKWEEDDLYDQKQHHADCNQQRIFVQIWQLSTFECKQEANKVQNSIVGNCGSKKCLKLMAGVTLGQNGCGFLLLNRANSGP